MGQGFYGFPNILGLLRATTFRALGKPGASAGAELAGGTTAGAPTSGEHGVGELVVDHTGTLWICTVAGTPGTWTQVVGGSGSYTLPAATSSTLGGIKAPAGSGLAVEADGTLHAGTQTPPARIWRQSISPGAPTTVTTSTLENDGAHNAFPGLAATRSGKLIAVYRRGSAHVSAASSICYRVSSDGGATWGSRQTLITASSPDDYRDPCIVCTQSGRLIVSYFRYNTTTSIGEQIRTSYSDDDGATWSAAAAQTPYAGDNFTGGAILPHSSGALLLPVYGAAVGGAADTPGLLRSVDDGTTWGSLITVTASTDYNEQGLVELPNHTVRSYIRFESGTSGLYYADSADGGLTWGSLSAIGFSAFGGRATPVLVPVSQELILFYRHITDQSCAWRYSTDLGATWSAETIINANAYVYAGACPLADGLVGIVYADQYAVLASADLQFLTLATGVPTVSGSRSGNAALASLLSGLAQEGDILDGTTAGTAPPTGLAVSHNGTAVATEAGLNLVDGSNVTLTVADNSGSSRVDVTVTSTSSTVSSLLMILPNVNNFVADGSSDEQPPDFITLASGDVIGCGGL